MAAAERCKRTNHGVADRPLHHNCRGQMQMGIGSLLDTSRCSRTILRSVATRSSAARNAVPLAWFAVVLTSCAWAWAGSASKSTSPVRVWEDSITIPTSEEGLPDPNPPFDLFTTGGFYNYPYTLRHNLVDRRVPRKWRTLNLENEYLKCSIL